MHPLLLRCRVLAAASLVFCAPLGACNRCPDNQVQQGGACVTACNSDDGCTLHDRCEEGVCVAGVRTTGSSSGGAVSQGGTSSSTASSSLAPSSGPASSSEMGSSGSSSSPLPSSGATSSVATSSGATSGVASSSASATGSSSVAGPSSSAATSSSGGVPAGDLILFTPRAMLVKNGQALTVAFATRAVPTPVVSVPVASLEPGLTANNMVVQLGQGGGNNNATLRVTVGATAPLGTLRVTFGPTTSTAIAYNGLQLPPLELTVVDAASSAPAVINNIPSISHNEGGLARVDFNLLNPSASPRSLPVSITPASEGAVNHPVTYSANAVASAGQGATVTFSVDGVVGPTRQAEIVVGPLEPAMTPENLLPAMRFPVFIRNRNSVDINASFSPAPVREGATTTLQLTLNAIPAAPVTLTVTSNSNRLAVPMGNTRVLDTSTWNTVQVMDIAVVNNDVPNGDSSEAVSITATSADPAWQALAPSMPTVVVRDDERLFFVTASQFAGTAVGGMTTADAACATDANRPPSLGARTVQAVYAVGTWPSGRGADYSIFGSYNWPLFPSSRYFNASGPGLSHVFTTNAAGLVLFPVVTPLPQPATPVWTGLNADQTTGEKCSDWTAAGVMGMQGHPWAATTDFLSATTAACSTTASLLCAE